MSISPSSSHQPTPQVGEAQDAVSGQVSRSRQNSDLPTSLAPTSSEPHTATAPSWAAALSHNDVKLSNIIFDAKAGSAAEVAKKDFGLSYTRAEITAAALLDIRKSLYDKSK